MEKNDSEKGRIYSNQVAWDVFDRYLKTNKPTKVFVITDENTQKLCLPLLLENVGPQTFPQTITIPAGEAHKNISTSLYVWESLSNKGADKTSLVINLGGGVVTDLGGFVASTFKRGVPFINIPTSLLGMVDASVGGKNGVDLGHLKNQIGVINLPEMVLLDTRFLRTLPREHVISGFAEMLKHGLIHSKAHWERVKNTDFSDIDKLQEMLWDSVAVKNEIVAKDPLENNLRKTLNYGHTLGHAIESYFLEHRNKPALLHGEAIAVGIILATHISTASMGFPGETLQEITETVLNYFPKQRFDKTDIDAVIELLVFDKKNRNGKVLFVLLEDIGKHRIDCEVDNGLIYKAFEYYKDF